MTKTMYEISGISKYGVPEEFYNLFIEHSRKWVSSSEGSWDTETIEALNSPEDTKSKRFLNKHCRQDWMTFGGYSYTKEEVCDRYIKHFEEFSRLFIEEA